jgi:2-phosphosulfolactate phosphatase
MILKRATLETCHLSEGLVVVIDVLRAFTTAAYLFDAGVPEIILAGEIAEAFALREQMPDCLLAGELRGGKIPGFDLGNSPSQIERSRVAGRRVIQRTTRGTQGVVRARSAQTILAASLVNLNATARFIQSQAADQVTFVPTGILPGKDAGNEDVVCAECLEKLLTRGPIDWGEVERRVRQSDVASLFDDAPENLPRADLEMALRVDCFDFAMVVDDQNRMQPKKS